MTLLVISFLLHVVVVIIEVGDDFNNKKKDFNLILVKRKASLSEKQILLPTYFSTKKKF